jgi:predicted transcriptional regulator
MLQQKSAWTPYPSVQKCSKSFLAAEAIAAYVESEEWQLGELQAGMAEPDSGQTVSHEKVKMADVLGQTR